MVVFQTSEVSDYIITVWWGKVLREKIFNDCDEVFPETNLEVTV